MNETKCEEHPIIAQLNSGLKKDFSIMKDNPRLITIKLWRGREIGERCRVFVKRFITAFLFLVRFGPLRILADGHR